MVERADGRADRETGLGASGHANKRADERVGRPPRIFPNFPMSLEPQTHISQPSSSGTPSPGQGGTDGDGLPPAFDLLTRRAEIAPDRFKGYRGWQMAFSFCSGCLQEGKGCGWTLVESCGLAGHFGSWLACCPVRITRHPLPGQGRGTPAKPCRRCRSAHSRDLESLIEFRVATAKHAPWASSARPSPQRPELLDPTVESCNSPNFSTSHYGALLEQCRLAESIPQSRVEMHRCPAGVKQEDFFSTRSVGELDLAGTRRFAGRNGAVMLSLRSRVVPGCLASSCPSLRGLSPPELHSLIEIVLRCFGQSMVCSLHFWLWSRSVSTACCSASLDHSGRLVWACNCHVRIRSIVLSPPHVSAPAYRSSNWGPCYNYVQGKAV